MLKAEHAETGQSDITLGRNYLSAGYIYTFLISFTIYCEINSLLSEVIHY